MATAAGASAGGGPPAGGAPDATAGADPHAAELARFRELVPPLGGNYKGAHGKVMVVGGCLEFTGAPFFAAMSALRVGADMAYVVCTPSAAGPIKAYSPELMVLPYLPEVLYGGGAGEADAAPYGPGQAPSAAAAAALKRIEPWLERASVVVLGPGLGDGGPACGVAALLADAARRRGLPLVVDGSALSHVVAVAPHTVSGYGACVLTPNVAELGRIARAVGPPLPGHMSDAWLAHAPAVAAGFKGPVVLAKGGTDLVCAANTDGAGGAAAAAAGGADGAGAVLHCCADAAAERRCGGQGDVLAGTLAAFLGWAAKRQQQQARQQQQQDPAQQTAAEGAALQGLPTETAALCALVACKVMRAAARDAYAAHERSMLAGDIIPHLYPAFKRVVGCR